ncbi:hypothetical protein [Dysosmobacter sp.]|uniref:hypothetical protein n=1 Tax=Dysosmobacter sp. TaxID=2591382 RepID=UPI003FD89F21
MKAQRLFQVLGLIDEDLIDEAWTYAPAAKKPPLTRRMPWLRGTAVAACCVLVCTFGFFYLVTGGFRGMGSYAETAAPETAGDSADAGSATSEEAESNSSGGSAPNFLSYAGPVLPLTTLESDTGLTAERALTFDFTPGTDDDGSPRQWGAQVTDHYVLTNPTEADVTVTALYPVTGSFASLGSMAPQLTVNGSPAEAILYGSSYAGTFGDENDRDGSTHNLAGPYSWEDYAALVSDEGYLTDALGDGPDLSTPVIVYRFSDFSAPHETYRAATQAVEFTIDESTSTILSYGFNGLSLDAQTGWRRYDYFVPDGIRKESNLKVLVVLGEDISSYTLQGYSNGACETAIDGVTCTVTRQETTLEDVLQELCRTELAQYTDQTQWPELSQLPLELHVKAAAELLTEYGPLSDAPMDRYTDGRLDDLLNEALFMDRVLYLAVPVTIPAGGSTELSVTFWKEPSYDFAGSGTGREGLQDFGVLTTAGSNLDFSSQTAALVNGSGVEIWEDDFGLVPEGDAVSLDLSQAYYHLTVRPVE